MRISSPVHVALVIVLALLLAAVSTALGGPAATDSEIGLPGNILVADAANNRIIELTPGKRIVWEFPRPTELAPGQSFLDPDDAFYTPGGRTIITNQEDNHTITIIDYADAQDHLAVWPSRPSWERSWIPQHPR